jgi:hypothetical protein
LVNPFIVSGLPLPEAVWPPFVGLVMSVAVTVYEVMGEPLDPGDSHDTTACPLPALAMAAVGAPGTPAGVTAELVAEAEPVPTRLVAVTVNV